MGDAARIGHNGAMPARPVAVFVFLLFLSALSGCERQQTPPAASPGGELVRAVVLSPALGRIVRDLGLEDRVVGRHAWDRGFDGAPSVGDQSAIDYERLRRTNPTHVLLQWGRRELPARLVGLAQSEGWELVNIEILSYDEIAAATRRVAEVIGGAASRSRAEDLIARLDRAARPRDGLPERAGRTVSLYGIDPLGVAGPESFTHELIERIGADAIPDDGAAFISMDPEDLRRLDPDTVVVWAPGIQREEKEAIVGRLERLELRAAQERRIIFVEHEGALLPSTSMIGSSEELAEKLLALPARSIGG